MSTENKKNMEELLQGDIDLGGFDGSDPFGDMNSGTDPFADMQGVSDAFQEIEDTENPFENALENAAYRTDYRRFLPQILLPDFHIPLFPEREERSRIRRQMNTAGAGALLGCMGSQLLFPLMIMVLLLCMDGTAASYFNGDQSGAIRTMESSGIYMALHCLIFGGMNTLVAWLGCRRIRQPLGGLFRTTDFSGWKAFQYICIGFALQQISVVLYAVTRLLHLELPEASFDYFDLDFYPASQYDKTTGKNAFFP